MIYIAWFFLSILVGSLGSSKSKGGIGAFFISLFFSPIIGLIVVLASSPKRKIKKVNPKIFELTKKAINADNKEDFETVEKLLYEALTYDAKDSQTHYNLSLLFSKIKDKENAFKHLEKAIEYGYKKFNKIAESKDLVWLREQSEYNDFISNGYKLIRQLKKENDYIQELKELNKLKESGVITESEFENKKKVILNS